MILKHTDITPAVSYTSITAQVAQILRASLLVTTTVYMRSFPQQPKNKSSSCPRKHKQSRHSQRMPGAAQCNATKGQGRERGAGGGGGEGGGGNSLSKSKFAGPICTDWLSTCAASKHQIRSTIHSRQTETSWNWWLMIKISKTDQTGVKKKEKNYT